MKVVSADEAVKYEERLDEREKRLLEMKRDPPVSRTRNAERDELLRELYADGHTAAQLVERFGLSARTVFRIVQGREPRKGEEA